MKINYDKLLGRIVEVYGNQSNFAKDMKLSERSISFWIKQRKTLERYWN